MADRTYLELDDGVTRKFFELYLDNGQISVRYGEIGTAGQETARDFPTPAAARAEAEKMIEARRRKGYEEPSYTARGSARAGKRLIDTSNSDARPAPVLWRFDTGNRAFGVFADDRGCVVGNEDGRIFLLDRDGLPRRGFQLPEAVKCIVADGAWLYAGCDDGKVYDLTGARPAAAYAVDPGVDIYWLDICDGRLAVSDAKGAVYAFDHEGEPLWDRQGAGEEGWMVRCDERGVYHGHAAGLVMHRWADGGEGWSQDWGEAVLFGWQTDQRVYAATSARRVHCFTKDGDLEWFCDCDAGVYCCAAAPDGRRLFAGDCDGAVYCFDDDGERLWKLTTGCGSALSMHYHAGRLYVVTTRGFVACIDASDAAIGAAQGGALPAAREVARGDEALEPADLAALPTVSDPGAGVVVECFAAADGQLRVRAISPGYRPDWSVQFPADLREDGARFAVDEVRESARGGFYRALGDIKRLADSDSD